MKIADIEQQLIQAGCKSVHIERFWRNWYSGKPLNRSKVRLPAAAEAILPQMEEYLANQLTAQEKAESETGTRWVLKADRMCSSSARGRLCFYASRMRSRVCLLYDRQKRSHTSVN